MYDEVLETPTGPSLYKAPPADVYAWLTDPANSSEVNDTTRVRYGSTLQLVYASEYIANYIP